MPLAATRRLLVKAIKGLGGRASPLQASPLAIRPGSVPNRRAWLSTANALHPPSFILQCDSTPRPPLRPSTPKTHNVCHSRWAAAPFIRDANQADILNRAPWKGGCSSSSTCISCPPDASEFNPRGRTDDLDRSFRRVTMTFHHAQQS